MASVSEWREITRAKYYEVLEILPPALVTAHGFLQGEPFDFRTCKVTGHFRATYAAYVEHAARYYAGPNMTTAEFRAFKPEDLA